MPREDVKSLQRLKNKVVIISALDKVTARIKRLTIPVNDTVQFGSLIITPRVCYSSLPEFQPKTSTFIQVDEILLNGNKKRLFSGWMFAESPALNSVEHPVFDIWLTSCEKPHRQTKDNNIGQNKMGPTIPSTTLTRRRIRR